MSNEAQQNELVTRRWEANIPAGHNVRARMVWLHGIISHTGWYEQSCQFLADHGIEVHFLDRRGSGQNSRQRGDIDDWSTWFADVKAYLDTLPKDQPILLGGISWGGKLAAAMLHRYPNCVDALALICPGIYAHQFPSATKYRLLSFLRGIGLGALRVPIPLNDPTLFTDVDRWQRFIAEDPLTLRKITVRFALEDRKLTQLARHSAASIQVPTWMVLAGRDRIVDNPLMESFYDSIASPAKRLTVYPEAAHTFEFEPDPKAYFEDLASWIDEVVDRCARRDTTDGVRHSDI